MQTPTWRCNRKLMAAGIKLASYSVTDPLRSNWTEEQFHLTYNNTLIASLRRSTVEFLRNFLSAQEHMPMKLPTSQGGEYTDRIVMFEEEQDNDESWTIIHVYEDGQIRARMGVSDAKLLINFLEDPRG